MKNISLILLLFCFFTLNAQNTRNCVTPISNFAFQQLITNLSAKSDEAQKLAFSKRIARENCLSTEQVKQIAEMFGNDYNKLAFVQIAFDNTTDKDNFYEVYNAFSYFSTVFRLHDYVTARKGDNKVVTEEPQSDVMNFPPLDYPDFRKYYGKTGCTNIVPESEFQIVAEKVFKEFTEERKLTMANNIAASYCMQTAQAMKISSLLKNEQSRLDFLKRAYTKVYDPDNYKYALQVFNTELYKKEFNTFIGGGATVITTDNPPCEVSQQDFTNIKTQISKQSFVNTKVNIAKQNIKSKKCFKTTQIIEILTLFTYSDSKMDIAKFAYDFTTDKENYVKIADSFSFTNDKNVFLEFLKTK